MTSLSRLVPVLAAMAAISAAAALDHEFAYAPYKQNVPADTPHPEYFVGVDGMLKSKVLDDYRVIHDDAAIGLNSQVRAYGLGLGLDTDWALGQSPDISRPGDKVNPGELLRVGLTIDWAIEISDPRDPKIPLLQIIPHFSYVTYPNQRDIDVPGNRNWLKDRQRWLGADVWWALPVEGVELGAGLEQNISTAFRATRIGLGGRQFIQYSAVDLAFWQLLNFSDAEWREAVGGVHRSGMNTMVAGARVTMPVFVKDVFAFVESEASYWPSKAIRNNLRDSGQDGGNVVLSVGLNWMPE